MDMKKNIIFFLREIGCEKGDAVSCSLAPVCMLSIFKFHEWCIQGSPNWYGVLSLVFARWVSCRSPRQTLTKQIWRTTLQRLIDLCIVLSATFSNISAIYECLFPCIWYFCVDFVLYINVNIKCCGYYIVFILVISTTWISTIQWLILYILSFKKTINCFVCIWIFL